MIRWKSSFPSWFFVALVGVTVSVNADDVLYKGRNVIQRGKPFTIECRISVFDYPKWTKDGYEIDHDGPLEYQLSERKDGRSHLVLSLHVERARREHAGHYRCNSFSRKAHKVALLHDDEPDYFEEDDDSTSSVVLKVNQMVKVFCNIASDNTFPVLWFKDNYRLLPGKNSNLAIKGRYLIIKNAQEADAGEYMCKSTDVNTLSKPAVSGRDEVIGHITTVKYPAEVEPFPEKMSLRGGEHLILECKVHGSPVPSVQWFIGNVPASFYIGEYDLSLELLPNEQGVPDAILYIHNVTEEDMNLYTCRAKNSLNVAEASIFVIVRDDMIVTNEKEKGAGIVLETGKALVLQCNLTTPNVGDDLLLKWKKDYILLSDSDIIKIDTANNSLVINKPNENNHTGMYVCIFEDSLSRSYANATIIVSTRPSVEAFHKSLNLVQGDRLVLNCKYGGNPTPNINWLKDDNPLNMSDSRISITTDTNTKTSQLKIDDLDYPDRADYTCAASFGDDVANTTILVRVKDRLAALWPFLGICAEVAILCTIIFVYEKKRAKPEFEDADADQAADKKNIQDQKEGHDVRQRK